MKLPHYFLLFCFNKEKRGVFSKSTLYIPLTFFLELEKNTEISDFLVSSKMIELAFSLFLLKK